MLATGFYLLLIAAFLAVFGFGAALVIRLMRPVRTAPDDVPASPDGGR